MLKFIINLEDDTTQEAPIREDAIIGRSGSGIVIPDRQISSKHAIIKVDSSSGHFFLKDLGSTNGIILGGERVKEALLIPGVKITLGHALLTVVEEEQVQPPKAPEISHKNLFEDLHFINQKEDREFLSFDQIVQFEFVRGPLNKTSWEIYWGPLIVGTRPGSYSLIDEELEPGLDIFELSKTTNAQALFIKRLHEIQIKVNGTYLQNDGLIENGDLIEIAQTAFFVRIQD